MSNIQINIEKVNKKYMINEKKFIFHQKRK